MANNAITPGQKQVAPLTGSERVEIRIGAQVAETSTQDIANLTPGGGSVSITSDTLTLTPSPLTDVGTIEMPDTGVVADTYGDGGNAVVVTVDAQGRVTAINTDPIIGGAVSITSSTLTVNPTPLTGEGTIDLTNVIKPATVGSSISVPQVQVDAQGRVISLIGVGIDFVAGGASATKTVAVQFDKTNDTALADIPGLSVDLATGEIYTFNAVLFTAANIGTGVKVAIGGTATANFIIADATDYAGGLALAVGTSRATALATAFGGLTGVVTRIEIEGTISVLTGGTLTVQFAENAGIAATTSSVLVGSSFTVTKQV